MIYNNLQKKGSRKRKFIIRNIAVGEIFLIVMFVFSFATILGGTERVSAEEGFCTDPDYVFPLDCNSDDVDDSVRFFPSEDQANEFLDHGITGENGAGEWLLNAPPPGKIKKVVLLTLLNL